jgi:hypothetical protein
MAADWYMTRQGKKYGPFTEENLRELASTNRLLPSDLVWQQGMAQWAAAGTIGMLFPQAEIGFPGVSGSPRPTRSSAMASEAGMPVIKTGPSTTRKASRPKKSNQTLYTVVAITLPLVAIASALAVSLMGSQSPPRNRRREVVASEQTNSKVANSPREQDNAPSTASDSGDSELRERIINKVCEVSIAHAIEQRGKLVSMESQVAGLSGNASMGPIYSPNRPAMLMQLQLLLRRRTRGVTDQSQFEALVQAAAQEWMTEYLTAPIRRGVND